MDTARVPLGSPGTWRPPSWASPRPFRYLDEHWPERVEGMIEAAETGGLAR